MEETPMGKTIIERTKGGRVKSRKYVPHPNPVMEALESADDEGQDVAIINEYLLTPEQDKWLRRNRLNVSDLMNGRYDVGLDNEIHEKFFKAWNAKLGPDSNGKPYFIEEPMGMAMLDSINKMAKDLGMDGFTFG
jgi:hypothetical protein